MNQIYSSWVTVLYNYMPLCSIKTLFRLPAFRGGKEEEKREEKKGRVALFTSSSAKSFLGSLSTSTSLLANMTLLMFTIWPTF